MNYRVLVLQEQSHITLGLLKLRNMVEQGLIIVGARPQQTVGLQSYSVIEEKSLNNFVTNYGERPQLQWWIVA